MLSAGNYSYFLAARSELRLGDVARPIAPAARNRFAPRVLHRAGSVVLALYGIVPDARPDDVHACRREVTALDADPATI